nr:ctenidin-3-like [Arachis hypogaea]
MGVMVRVREEWKGVELGLWVAAWVGVGLVLVGVAVRVAGAGGGGRMVEVRVVSWVARVGWGVEVRVVRVPWVTAVAVRVWGEGRAGWASGEGWSWGWGLQRGLGWGWYGWGVTVKVEGVSGFGGGGWRHKMYGGSEGGRGGTGAVGGGVAVRERGRGERGWRFEWCGVGVGGSSDAVGCDGCCGGRGGGCEGSSVGGGGCRGASGAGVVGYLGGS